MSLEGRPPTTSELGEVPIRSNIIMIVPIDLSIAHNNDPVSAGGLGFKIHAAPATFQIRFSARDAQLLDIPGDFGVGQGLDNFDFSEIYVTNVAAAPGTTAEIMIWTRR